MADANWLSMSLLSTRWRVSARQISTGQAGATLRAKEIGMSLEDKLGAVRDASAKRMAPERLAIMHRATEDLRSSGALDRVIKPATKAPDFTLNDQNGNPVTLSALTARGPVVMSVFRGFW
jgi:hypothetical protein